MQPDTLCRGKSQLSTIVSEGGLSVGSMDSLGAVETSNGTTSGRKRATLFDAGSGLLPPNWLGAVKAVLLTPASKLGVAPAAGSMVCRTLDHEPVSDNLLCVVVAYALMRKGSSQRPRKVAVEARKREGIPTASVFPCRSELETDLFKKASNALVCDYSKEVQWSACSSPSANCCAQGTQCRSSRELRDRHSDTCLGDFLCPSRV